MKHLAKFKVSMELLRDALALPDDLEIIDIHVVPTSWRTFEFVIEHPEAPVCPPGGEIREISPVFRTDQSKKPSTWITCDLYDTMKEYERPTD